MATFQENQILRSFHAVEGIHAGEAAQTAPGEWYALTVKPRHDKSVAHTLGMKGYETLAPTYRKRHVYGTRTRENELPLFPGYVFCRLDVMRRLPILTTPGVIQIVGAGRMPLAVDETEIESLRTAIRAGIPLQPYPFFEAGQKVRIEEGSMAGVEGVVVSLRQGPRLVLSITLLQRSVLLEIDCNRVSLQRSARSAVARQIA